MTIVAAAVLGLVVGPLVRLVIERVSTRQHDADQPSASTGKALLPMLSWASPAAPSVGGTRSNAVVAGQTELRRAARWRAPTIDLAVAVTFVAMAWATGWSPILLPLLVFGAAAVALSVVDIDEHRLPDQIIFTTLSACAVLLVVVSMIENVPGALVGAALGAVAYSGFLFVLFLVSPAGLGLGDVKLALLLGLMLGWIGAVDDIDGVLEVASVLESLTVVLLGALAGTVIGAVVGQIHRLRSDQRTAFPLGPSLCIGALAVMVVGVPT